MTTPQSKTEHTNCDTENNSNNKEKKQKDMSKESECVRSDVVRCFDRRLSLHLGGLAAGCCCGKNTIGRSPRTFVESSQRLRKSRRRFRKI